DPETARSVLKVTREHGSFRSDRCLSPTHSTFCEASLGDTRTARHTRRWPRTRCVLPGAHLGEPAAGPHADPLVSDSNHVADGQGVRTTAIDLTLGDQWPSSSCLSSSRSWSSGSSGRTTS